MARLQCQNYLHDVNGVRGNFCDSMSLLKTLPTDMKYSNNQLKVRNIHLCWREEMWQHFGGIICKAHMECIIESHTQIHWREIAALRQEKLCNATICLDSFPHNVRLTSCPPVDCGRKHDGNCSPSVRSACRPYNTVHDLHVLGIVRESSMNPLKMELIRKGIRGTFRRYFVECFYCQPPLSGLIYFVPLSFDVR